MSRPLLNLWIVELRDKLDASNGATSVALELVKELRHRTTPKAVALSRRVLAIIASNPSPRAFQSLLLPELAMLVVSHLHDANVRTALVEVLGTRNSPKAQKLLEMLTTNGRQVSATDTALTKNTSTPLASQRTSDAAIDTSVTASVSSALPPILPSQADQRQSSATETSRMGSNLEQSFALFGVSIEASWSEIEGARQKLVFQYRPGSGVEKDHAQVALKGIADAYVLLAKHMQSKR
jgi:hypothetical protein